ncbi:MAG: DEAD/DEAH box helicase, partial [Chthoniobacteraceae bacterium]
KSLLAILSFDQHCVTAWIDAHGAALLDPPIRNSRPSVCENCPELSWCESIEIHLSPADAWRRLGLIDPHGVPTRRGTIFSFFHHGEGLAIAAALEDERYPIPDLIYDLANLRAGPRFAGDDSPYGGRLGIRCAETYLRAEIPGYLTLGVPLDYGAGASEAIRAHLENGVPRSKLLTDDLRSGDFERALIEWRSLLRQITWAPDDEWPRWQSLRRRAVQTLGES